MVAFGTSAPETAVSVQASLGGSGDIAVGNVIGSNIANILLILGLSALIAPLVVSRQLIRLDVPVMIGAGLLCYASGRDEAEAVRETVAILREAGLAPLDVTGHGTLEERLADLADRLPERLSLHVNGCPNSCARIQTADIGLKGQLLPDDDGGQTPGFQVHLGGGLASVDRAEAGLGRSVRGLKVRADGLVDYVERLVRRYDEQREPGETSEQALARMLEEEFKPGRRKKAGAEVTASAAD